MRNRLTMMLATMFVATMLRPSFAGQKDVVDTAVEAGHFNTLATALTKAELVSALKGEGPFTVFAPTDTAFAKLPKGTVESLLKPENKAKLVAILTYHVVPGKVAAKDVVKLSAANTLNGQRIDIKTSANRVMIDGASVTTTDIMCSNGVIHVIDTVILPSSDDIVDTAVKAGSFKTLAAALKAAGLIDALKGDGPFTVFAPTDAAFAKLPKGTVESLLKPENREQLAAILKYHVAAGRVFSSDLPGVGKIETLQGSTLTPRIAGGKAMINDANVVTADIDASNGVIHVIDTVLLPPKQERVGSADPRDVIRLAIERGVPQFNHGHHAACAAIYEVTAQGLMGYNGIGCDQRARLASALREVRRTHDEAEQAWILRRALDDVYRKLDAGEMRMSMMTDMSESRTR